MRDGSIELRKVLGTDNPADMMTKHLLRDAVDKCMSHLRQRRVSGRARLALDIQGKGAKVESKGQVAQEEELKISTQTEKEEDSFGTPALVPVGPAQGGSC